MKLETNTGVYFLFNDDKLVYVGMSSHLSRRIQQSVAERKAEGHDITDFAYHTVKTRKEAEILERVLISELRPPANRMFNTDDSQMPTIQHRINVSELSKTSLNAVEIVLPPPIDVSAVFSHSMLISSAWISLSPKQQSLYLHCKVEQVYQHLDEKEEHLEENCFYFNKKIWNKKYKLYSETSDARLVKDMRGLIQKGFVDCIHSGQKTRTKNVYRLSERWQNI